MRSRTCKKLAAAAASWALALTLVLGTAVCSYAELQNLRDGDVDIELPAGWYYEEIDASESEGHYAEHILTADDEDTDSPLSLDIFFVAEESDYYLYMDGREEAWEYYAQYGQTVLTEFYESLEGYQLISASDPGYFDGEWIDYAVITATVSADINEDGAAETFEELIYLTASEQMVHKLLIFSGYDPNYPAADMTETAEPIVDSFYDYGYDEVMLGIDGDYYDYGYEDDYSGSDGISFDAIIAIFTGLIPIMVITGVGVAVIKKKKGYNPAGGGLQNIFGSIKERIKSTGTSTQASTRTSARRPKKPSEAWGRAPS
ncbi:MAG: hypothetical protein Q4C25_02865, partial [Bacillota bacterium]|nr:hypothetical protein [Bacillota bacterium]